MIKEVKWKFTNNKKQMSGKVAQWIVDSILKLPSSDLKVFWELIEKELMKRGEF